MKFLLKIIVITLFVSCSVAFNPEQDIKFFLFTRKNPIVPQELKLGNLNSVLQSNFIFNQPLR